MASAETIPAPVTTAPAAAPGILRRVGLVVEGHARFYRRTWRSSAVSTFLTPLLYLAAMGIGLGTLVDRGVGDVALDAGSYVEFLAPGLLAAATMQTGAGDAAWPVMAGLKWRQTYQATLATPIGVPELALGHLVWLIVRCAMTAAAFATVSVLLGALTPLRAALAVLPATLTGVAFGAPITAFTARLKSEMGLTSLFRFGIVPMFLFSGTFFPVEQLPDWIEPVALATPLWHGVELTRAVALDLPTRLPAGVHLLYLVALVAGGAWMAVRGFVRRLQP